MTIDVVLWEPPNYVSLKMPPGQRQDGWSEPPRLLLKDVDAEVLAMLCKAFRAEVFRKAGKPDPSEGHSAGDGLTARLTEGE